MSSIRQPSRLELTRLTSIAERLSGLWQHLAAHEVLSEILTGNAFIKNPSFWILDFTFHRHCHTEIA